MAGKSSSNQRKSLAPSMIFSRPKSQTDNESPKEKDSRGLMRIRVSGLRRKQEKSDDVVKESFTARRSTASTKCSRSSICRIEEVTDMADDAASLQRCKVQANVLTCDSATTLADARGEAQQRQEPLLVLVHGGAAQWRPLCDECSKVLKNPLLAEAAEALFSPIRVDASEAIDDELKRISGVTEQDIAGSPLPFLAIIADDAVMRPKMWTVAAIADVMIEARTAAGLHVPSYLSLLAEETSAAQCSCPAGPVSTPQRNSRRPPFSTSTTSHAFFGVMCHNNAEVHFAGLSGVLATEAGWLDQNIKAVQITYDSKRLSYGALVQHAIANTSTHIIYFNTNDQKAVAQIQMQLRQQQSHPISYTRLVQYTNSLHDFRNGADRKHYLRTTVLRDVPLTELQKIKANLFISNGKFNEAMKLLSPRQGLIFRACTQSTKRKIMQGKIDPIDVEIGLAWQVLDDFGFFD